MVNKKKNNMEEEIDKNVEVKWGLQRGGAKQIAARREIAGRAIREL